MVSQFVAYDIALKLKELGFNEHCLAFYDEKQNFKCYNSCPEYYKNLKAPLWQQVIDWFRVKYNLNIEVIYLPNICKYGFIISDKGFIPKNHTFKENYSRGSIVTDNFIKFDEYYDARKHVILKAIELCKQDVKKMDAGQE